MPRHAHGSRRDPLLTHHDRHPELRTLSEAKLAAWTLAMGEASPSPDSTRRRSHRGMLPDVLEPEPPCYATRPPLLKRLLAALSRLLGQADPADATQGPAIAYTDAATTSRLGSSEAAERSRADLPPAEDTQIIRSRAA